MNKIPLVCALLTLQVSRAFGAASATPCVMAVSEDGKQWLRCFSPGPGSQGATRARDQAIEASKKAPRKAAAPEMSREDLATNLPVVIDAFLRNHSPKGYWAFRARGQRRVWKLRLTRLEADRARRAGPGLYEAPLVLRDVETLEPLNVDFFVDFSGPRWRVTGMRLKPAAPRAMVASAK